jgi:N-acylneuraminate cytidylyltransferase
MKYVAIIPLRAGSKGIPRKNLKLLAGKPLFQWTLEAAAGTKAIDHVFVSTDDAEIKQAVESLALEKVSAINRSPETATDTASTESVLIEFAQNYDFENLILIQATSPLLRSEDLEAGIEEFQASAADSLLSVARQKRFLWEEKADGTARATNYDPIERPRRQDFNGFLAENGAFYISKRDGLLQTENRLFGKIATHEMPEISYFEIDEPLDWQIMEGLLQQRSALGNLNLNTTNAKPSLQELRDRAKKIKLFISDVDGVLTDSGMYYTEKGDEIKKFNTRDGKAFELLRNMGIKTGIITAENTKIVEDRARKLKIDYLEQGAVDKIHALKRMMQAAGVRSDEVAYVGDDLGDITALKQVALSFCPQDAAREAIKTALIIVQTNGGSGVIRNIYDQYFTQTSLLNS